MEILKIAGICACAAVLYMVLRQIRPEYAIVMLIGTTCIICVFGLSKITELVDLIRNLIDLIEIDGISVKQLVKCIGIGLIAETSCEICKDSGMHSVGEKVLWIGKILIIIEMIPFITVILDVIKELLSVGSF